MTENHSPAAGLNWKTKLRAFMEDRFLVVYDEDLPEDTDLFAEGIMDSFGYVQLHRFLQAEFGIAFTAADLTRDLLVSLTQIEAHVARHITVRTAAGQPL